MLARVLVVDDSLFMRKIIVDILSKDNMIKVVGIARNGEEALEKIKMLNPDVVTLDVEMPIKNGIETLKVIVEKYNISVIMVSKLTTEGANLTLKALDIGAFDFIQKPSNIFNIKNNDYETKLIEKVKIAYNSKLKLKLINNNIEREDYLKYNPIKNDKSTLVAIGTSTGGPKALQCIISKIPENINGAILIVQHMPPNFTKSLAKRLDSMSKIRVVEAKNEEIVHKGYCYIAPGGLHMIVLEQNGEVIIKLTDDVPVSGFRPSVDVLMNSVAEITCMKKIGVILTGMGSDGSLGMKKLHNNNGYTIAQNEESCIVYGMPKSSIKLGGVHKILSLHKIAHEIINKMGV